MATHVPCVPDWVVQEASRVQLEYRSAAAGVHVAAFVHWISVAGRSARILGRDCGNEHGACHAGAGHEGPFGKQLGMTPYNDVRFGLLGGSIVDANALLRSYIWHCIGIPIVASVLMIVHFWRVRKDGGISGPAPVMLASEVKEPRR